MDNKKFGEGLGLTEKHIRYAMENTQSNAQAAIFLNIAYNTYKKYAKLYFDKESGKSLFELHKNKQGKGITKGGMRPASYARLKEVLYGMHPDYPKEVLRKRLSGLIKESYFEEKCARCGFKERRVDDYSVPLLLDWIDGDTSNHRRDNLQLLCYNCYYLTVDNILGKKREFI